MASVNAVNPEIYVFDEPSANLDMYSVEALKNLMRELKSEGHTIIVAEHRLYYLTGLADRFLYMENGSIKEEWTPEELLSMPEAKRQNIGIRAADLRHIEVGIPSRKETDVTLEVKGLAFSYRKHPVFHDISFQAYAGDLIAIVGHNGIGKTTLSNILCGMQKEKAGQILYSGKDVPKGKRKNFAYFVMQNTDCQLFGDSVEEELFLNGKGSTQEQRDDAKLKKINEIPLEEIDEFPDHPFKVLDDEDMMNLAESVREQGIITPATLRKKEDGRYEILSGHRRKRACELAGLDTLRSEVVEMDRDAAVIFMVDSNLQRTTILPSEKAFSYKMRLEAMKRQGRRTDLTSRPVGEKLSVERLGEEVSESGRQVHRYIRLTELIPELLEKVDKGEIALRPAVDISYLPEDVQQSLLDTIEMEQCTPSYAQTRRMRTLLAEEKLTDEAIYAIMQEEKPNQKEKFTISASKIEKVLPQSVKASQREDFILKAIDYYAKHLQRKKEERER